MMEREKNEKMEREKKIRVVDLRMRKKNYNNDEKRYNSIAEQPNASEFTLFLQF